MSDGVVRVPTPPTNYASSDVDVELVTTAAGNVKRQRVSVADTVGLTDAELRASEVIVSNRHIDIVTGLPVDSKGFEGIQASYDIKDMVSKGIIPNHTAIFEFGDRDVLTTAVAGNDIWSGAAILYPHPAATGELMSIVSTSAQDGVGGTGIQAVDLHYLDATGAAQTLVVALNGTTPVDIPTVLFRFINSMHGESWGTGLLAVGTITIYRTGNATRIYSQISPSDNYSPDGTYMVPLGHQFFISNVSATATGSKAIKIIIRATSSYEGVLVDGFIFKRGWVLQDDSLSEELSPQLVLPALAVVKATAYSLQAGGRATINFSGWIEPT